jgi:hypothetical protein
LPAGRDLDVATLAYTALALMLGTMVVAAPLAVLLDRVIPDDAFYYFTPARNFVRLGWSTFDGINPTNGYQPLWFLVALPVFWLFPEGGELPFRILLAFQVVLTGVAAGVLVRVIGRLAGAVPAVVAGVLWLTVFHRVTLNGLETAALAGVYACLLSAFTTQVERGPVSARGAFVLGVLASAAFLARTDMAFVVIGLTVWILARSTFRSPKAASAVVPVWLAFLLPVGVICGGYLAVNLVSTGHLMPVSGAAKVFHSSVARSAAAQTAGGASSAYVANLMWPLRERGYHFVAASLIAPLGLVALSLLRRGDARWHRLVSLWPFYLGLWLSFLFYSLAFFGGFTKTIWYYGPNVVMAWLCLAALGLFVGGWRHGQALTVAVVFAASGLALGWLSWSGAAAALAGSFVAGLLARVTPESRRRVLSAVAAGTTIVGVAWLFRSRGVSVATWSSATVLSAILAGFIDSRHCRTVAVVQALAGIVLPTLSIHVVNLTGDLKAPPANWNYNLYLGAEWARENLPRDATIWSGSAGILGYFSDRRVVNTDGLANSHHFLETVLRPGRLGDYYRQWDYAIDAFPDEALAQYYPEGCFVPLPPEVTTSPFQDGNLTRRLRVFQMHSQGVVDCQNER